MHVGLHKNCVSKYFYTFLLDKLICTSHFELKQSVYFLQRRLKSKKPKWNEKTNVDRALLYYDTVYPSVYGQKWKSMKNALFEDPKYASLLNNFSDTDKILSTFEELGAYDVGEFYTKKVQNQNTSKSKIQISTEEHILAQDQPKAVRPSLIKLTDDEKANLANQVTGRYPNEYKKRALEGINHEHFGEESPRLIRTSSTSGKENVMAADHVPAIRLKGLEDWHEESDVFADAEASESEIGIKRLVESEPLQWPSNLKLYAFVKGEKSEFPSPKSSPSISVFTHYLFNGASILPVLALDLQLGDKVLDMCASPGGKSLAILQTYLPGLLVCNDVSSSRLERVRRVMDQYIPEELSSIRNSIILSKSTGTIAREPDSFDKVLVDAPCLNDRISLQESDNSCFKPSRTAERIKMPELQAELILSALKCTKPGGCVVYSTCTLSPIQNDGSVHLALTRVWKETKMDCTVVNMVPTLKNLNFVYKIGHEFGLRYGHIVIPTLDNNCGPMYVCKIIRNR